MKRVIIKVYGRVQGVFFRDSAKKKARKLGLAGWAKNENDGTVLIVTEGEKEKLNQLIDWLENGGPPFAKIDRVDIKWKEGTGRFEDFKIKF